MWHLITKSNWPRWTCPNAPHSPALGKGHFLVTSPYKVSLLPPEVFSTFTDKWRDGNRDIHDQGSTISDFGIFYKRVQGLYTLIELGDVSIKAGEPLTIDPANAKDSDAITVAVEGLPDGLSHGNGQITGTPTKAGKHTITVTYSDKSTSVTDTFTLTVGNVNDAPVLATEIPDATIKAGTLWILTINPANATDGDGDALTVRVDGLPNGLSYADGRITGTPTETGEHTITVTYSDASESVTDTFTLTVQAEETSTVLASAPAGESSTIKVYPNPASVQVTIEMNGPAKGYTLTVTDLIGHAVLTIRDLDGLMANNSLTLPVSQLRPGVYFLRFTDKGHSRPTVRKIQIKRD